MSWMQKTEKTGCKNRKNLLKEKFVIVIYCQNKINFRFLHPVVTKKGLLMPPRHLEQVL